MNVYIAAIFSFLLSLSCTASDQPQRTALIYDGYTFSIPDNPLLIASNAGDENLLILKYSAEKGKQYLSFSNINEDKSLNINCDAKIFFDYVFSEHAGNECNKDEIDSFKKIFITQQDTGTWRGKKMTIHYSISSEQSFMFAFGVDGKAIKIDTDFLSKSDLKNIIKDAL